MPTAGVVSRPFVGRQGELGTLTRALDAAATGSPSMVLVAADAGVGKTSLLSHFLGLPSTRGAWHTSGSCLDLSGESLPYGPIRDALRSFLRALNRRQVDALLEVAGGGLSGLLPELIRESDREPKSEHPSRQQRLFESVVDLLGWAGRIRPFVVVFEDLHWADPSSLSCISFINSSLKSERVLIVATYRTDELNRRHRLHGWIGEQLRKRTVRRIGIEAFDRSETEEMITGILEKKPSSDLTDRVYQQSEGNAFYIEELTESFATGGDRLPSSLSEVLLARVRRLSEETQVVMRTAAVGGREIVPDLLAAVLGRSGSVAERSLREAFENHIVAPSDGSTFAFRHALVHEVLLSQVLPGERERIHVAYAESMQERVDADRGADVQTIAQVAHHWFSAHETTRALAFAVKAGRAAVEVGAFDDAKAQLERAVSLWDATPSPESAAGMTRSQLLGQASSAAHLAGNPEAAVALVNAAIKEADVSGDDTETGLLYEMLGWYEFERGPRRESFPAYERALALIPADPPSVERARVLAAYARLHMLWSMYEEAEALAREALSVARSIGAVREEALALNPLGMVLGARGEVEASLSCLRRSVDLARRVGDFEEESRAYINLGEEIFRSGDVDGAISTWLDGYQRAYRTGLRKRSGSFLLCNVCEAMFEKGDWDGMEKTLGEAERWLSPGLNQAVWLTLSGHLAVVRGQFDTGRDHLREVQLMGGDRGHPELVRGIYLGLLELAVWEGQYDDAYRLTERALSELTVTDDWPWAGQLLMLGLRAQADRAQLLHAEAAEARRASDYLVELARAGKGDPLTSHTSPVQAAIAATCGAELQRLEGSASAASWKDVGDAWAAIDRPYYEAYARWRQAEAHALNRQKRPARDALARASEIAGSLGARPLMHEVKMLARRARLDLPPAGKDAEQASEEAPLEDRLGLTEREVDVLRQVAVGKTNREIAETLFISPKTASVHVTHILSKLGVTSRVAAAAMAHKVGLVDENQV